MKPILFSLVASFLFLSIQAKEKIVEKSGKQPKWVNSMEANYIVTSARSQDLEEAKERCMIRVKEQIVNSISENVRSSTKMSSSEETMNKQVSTFLESYSSTTTSQTGKTDFVQGISVTKVEDFYWEKIYDTETRKYRYEYHVKYPFSQKEMDDLVASYKMKDAELSYQLNKVMMDIPDMSSVEEVSAGISTLRSLKGSFVDLRADQANTGIAKLKAIIENMEFVVLSHKVGKLEYALQYEGRTMSYGKAPKVSSECATIEHVNYSGERTLITYNSDYCIAQDPNNGIDVLYKVGPYKMANRFRFNATAGKVEVDVVGTIRIASSGQASKVDLTIRSKYADPFVITKIDLDLKGAGISIPDVNKKCSGKGIHEISTNAGEIKASGAGMTSGTIYFKSEKTGEMGRTRFYNANYSVD